MCMFNLFTIRKGYKEFGFIGCICVHSAPPAGKRVPQKPSGLGLCNWLLSLSLSILGARMQLEARAIGASDLEYSHCFLWAFRF